MSPSKPFSPFLPASAVPRTSSPLAIMSVTSNSSIEKVYDMQDNSESKPFVREAEHDAPLPTPVSAPTPKPKLKLSAAAIIPIWIILSSTVIIYNNYLYNTLNFKYPVFLVTFHLGFAVSYSLLGRIHSNTCDSLAGNRHACPAANDESPRRSKRCSHD